jgi:hypothetical protein
MSIVCVNRLPRPWDSRLFRQPDGGHSSLQVAGDDTIEAPGRSYSYSRNIESL